MTEVSTGVLSGSRVKRAQALAQDWLVGGVAPMESRPWSVNRQSQVGWWTGSILNDGYEQLLDSPDDAEQAVGEETAEWRMRRKRGRRTRGRARVSQHQSRDGDGIRTVLVARESHVLFLFCLFQAKLALPRPSSRSRRATHSPSPFASHSPPSPRHLSPPTIFHDLPRLPPLTRPSLPAQFRTRCYLFLIDLRRFRLAANTRSAQPRIYPAHQRTPHRSAHELQCPSLISG